MKEKMLHLIRFISLFLWVFSASAFAQHTIAEQQLNVGIDLTYAPYAYLEQNKASGFDPDFMDLIAKKLKLSARFKDTRIENIIIGLNAQHYDVVASALYVNPQRAKQVDFLPYLQTGGVLVVRGDDTYRPKTLNDLCGKKISSMKGASWINQLNEVSQLYCAPKNLGKIEVKEFPSAPEAAQALLSKGVDVQYEDAAVAKMVIDSLGGRLAISSKEMLDPVIIGLAFRKDNSALKTEIDRAFKALRASGEYDQLLSKYNLAYPSESLLHDKMQKIESDTQVVPIKGFQWAYLSGLLLKKEFWQASLTVVKLSVFTWVLSVIFGFVLALLGQSKYSSARQFSKTYIWFFRSLPLLVLLIFIYNLPQILPSTSIILSSPFMAGLMALTISESAYVAEIHRGALQAIPKGQYEAGKALGISFCGIQRLIIIPQALRVALPTLSNQFVTIVKLTSLVSVISLTEILLVGQQLYTRNFLVMETLLAVAFYYVLIVSVLTFALKKWENSLDVSRNSTKMFAPTSSVDDKNIGRLDVASSHEECAQGISKKTHDKPREKMGEFALEIKHAKKQFGTTLVLNDLSIAIKWGEVLSIIGPSGSGKTTLIRSINGLELLDQGEIWSEGKQKIEHVGMVFQNFNLFPHKTVLENIMLAPIYHQQDKSQLKLDAQRILSKVGLSDFSAKYPHQLSGGQQQRVAIARALVMKPSIMLFDEPTSALDPELVNDVLLVIEALAKEGMTMIIVTHEMKFAFRISDRIVFMENGKIIHDAPPSVLKNSQDARLMRFLTPDSGEYSI